MTGALPRIDQMYFGWNQSEGEQSVLADSFDDPNAHQRWLRRLKPYIRLEPMLDLELPKSALSYFPFPDIGHAAVLRRVDTGVTTGRNDSHALVGPTSLLTAQVALGLAHWPGWESEVLIAPQWLSPERLAAEARQAYQSLHATAVRSAATLIPILAGRVAGPDSAISIIGCPDDLKPAMIWALIEIAHATRTGRPNPGFSTYEEQHDDSAGPLPHIVFLPARPHSRGQVSRTVVDLARPLPEAPMKVAQALYQQFVDGTIVPAAPNRPPAGDGATRPAEPRRPVEVRSARSAPVAPLTEEEALVKALRKARTLPDFDHALADLQRRSRGQRRLLREVLDTKALDDAAYRIEVTFREQLLRGLAEVAYGPGLEDLAEAQAEAHAVKVVRTTDSEQLAMIIGAAGRGQVPAAAFARWAAATRTRWPEPAVRVLRHLRARRRSHYLPLVAAAAVVAVLVVAFLGGVLLGRAGTATPVAAAPPAPRPAPTVELPAGLISGGYATVAGVRPADVTVVAFTKVGDTLQLQGPCLTASGDRWFCMSRGGSVRTSNAALVAYAMPRDLAEGVLTARVPSVPTKEWGNSYPVG